MRSSQDTARRRDLVAEHLTTWSLRIGLAFVFLFAALSSLTDPATFVGYFPSALPSSWATALLPVFGIYELLLALALVAGRHTYQAALVAALTLVAITAANPDAFDVLFRNVAIACSAVALAAQTRPRPVAPSARPAVSTDIEETAPVGSKASAGA